LVIVPKSTGRPAKFWFTLLCLAVAVGVLVLVLARHGGAQSGVDKLTYHGDAMRSGWNAAETRLTPAAVRSGPFGLVWQSPALDRFGKVPPRLFATPLYVHSLAMPRYNGAVAFVATTAGYAYAIAAAASGDTPAGTILWRRRLTEAPCGEGTIGNLSTPVIDRATQRLYVTACTGPDWTWHVHALDLRTGEAAAGWPVEISPATMDKPGINRNGTTRYTAGEVYLQRGALNLSPDAQRLYVAFGPDTQGWLVSIDTQRAGIASAFSTNPVQEQQQGGMWGSSGPSVDGSGHVYIATGASFAYTLAKRGIPGVFPDRAHSWGQSILEFADDRRAGLRLTGSYTPYNYCQTAAFDIDIGGSGAVLFDLPEGSSSTRRLLALGGGKQGNAYLLDREHMPGGIDKRHPCSTDPATDRSLLAPQIQPALGTRGPVNVFGPFSDSIGMTNQAKSRSTIAHFRDAEGRDHLYVSGSSKTGADFSTNVPPGLVRLEVVAAKGKPAYLRIAAREMKQTFANPGSPFVSSNAGSDAIVWLLDTAAPRSQDLFQPDAPHARLYAFDALTLELLWTSGNELFTTGKYNEPTVADGLVLVGTDRLQALGLGGRTASARGRPAASMATGRAAGRAVFEDRCAACHGAGMGAAPSVVALSAMDKSFVIAALTSGKMKPMATGLTAEQIATVADYVTSRGLKRSNAR
jgi:mono/diheme cytochrome c family protein